MAGHEYLSFWAINDALDIRKLTAQLKQLLLAGMDGVIFHPRYYPGQPAYMSTEYMKILSELILYAKAEGAAFWIYDENGWPSGTADGQVIKKYPHFKKQYVELRPDTEPVPRGGQVLESREGYHLVLVSENAPSPIDREATEAFIRLTHQTYKEKLDPAAFSYVTGFFSDEVSLPHNAELDRYASVPYLGEGFAYSELFFDTGAYRQTRVAFWEKAASLLAENFYRPIGDWCRRNGKCFTAHLKGEENPAFSVPFNGSPFTVLREVVMPCVDALERNVPNAYFPRIASSLAAQFGDGRCLCEALGGSGWGVEPAQFTRYINHLADCGITSFAMHIQQLKLDSTSKTDWPPSQPLHLGWKDAYASVLQEIRPTNRHADTLAVAPMRGVSAVYSARERVCTNVHNACVQPNTPATALSRDFIQMTSGLQDFHVTDEKQFECGASARQIGKCSYRHVVIHKGCLFARKPEQTAFTVQQPEENLLVYPDGDGRELAGKFLVLSRNGYVDDGEVLHTAFDFFTQPEGPLDASNLTASGLPFCNVPVAMEKELVLDRDYPHAIYFFEQFHADCARVYVDGADAGFYWSNRENTMPFPLAAGRHCLKIWLYPSAFNRFGPHNHIDGDVYTCSPGQFTGEKNFADRQDAPLNTRTPEIHVKKFGIGALAVF